MKFCTRAGWPDALLKNYPKFRPTHFFSILFFYLKRGKRSPKVFGYFSNFRKTAQSKHLPKRRKFALSGHPVSEEETALLAFYELRMNFQNANLAKNRGSMLRSQISSTFDNFQRNNWRFYQKPMLWSKSSII
jgi:hypothetical protein